MPRITKRAWLLAIYVSLLIPFSTSTPTLPISVRGAEHPSSTSNQVSSNQTSVSKVTTDVISAATDTAWIVIPDYTFGMGQVAHSSARKCGRISAAAVSDTYAANHLFGALANPQNEILDTNPAYVSQSTCGQPLMNMQPIVGIAGPLVNEVVSYYEIALAPLYFHTADGCIVRRDTGAKVDCSSATATTDVFLIEAFVDQKGSPVYILYGRSWPGTLAAVTYLVDFVSKTPSQYAASWYVYKWRDATTGPSANSVPDNGDSFTLIANSTTSSSSSTELSLASSADAAWQYFGYGNGINPTSKLPRGSTTWNAFTFWDFAMAIDGTIAGYKNGFIAQSDYQSRINILLGFLETMPLVNGSSQSDNNMPYSAYNWDGTPNSRVCDYDWNCNLADPGRLLNSLGYLRRQDSSYASTIDNILVSNRLNPWFNKVCSISWANGVYARDVELGCTYFSYINSSYDKTSLLNSFYNTWTSSLNRITDSYGNSMPPLSEVNLGPVSYELLEGGPDHANTLRYASDMKSWAAKRYQVTGKYGLWGSEFCVKLSDGSTVFAWEYYVALVPNRGYQSWQVKLVDGTWLDENDPKLVSTVSSLDAAYALRVTFPNDAWITSVFPAFQQNDLVASAGMYQAIFENNNAPDALINIPHNAVVLLSNLVSK